MPSTFEEATKNKNQSQIRSLLQREDAKELLLMKDGIGRLPIHDAFRYNIDKTCFQLIFDAGDEHGIAQEMLEEKTSYGSTCLHYACANKMSPDSLRLLLEYLAKHTDIRKMLEDKDKYARTCLACYNNLFTDSLQLLISFFPSNESLQLVLGSKDLKNKTPIDHARNDETKQLLRDPECFEKCRLWLLRNHEDTLLFSLFPNSFEMTCQALKELTKNGLEHSQQHATIMLIALIPSSSAFREAVNKTDSSAPMSSYFNVVKKGDKKSDCNHWRKNIRLFREFYGQWPPSERETASTYEGEGSSSCSIQ